MKVENAQPQTILAEDGFPIENLKFCGDAQEVMAVIQGRKPVAINSVDKNYIHMDTLTSLKSKKKSLPVYHECKPYTYEQIYKASKQVHLLRSVLKIENDTLYYYFLKENMKDAYLFSRLWERKVSDFKQFNFNDTEFNIIIGILLGYNKKDILAWFLMELQNLFKLKFDNLDKRSSTLQSPAILQKRKEIASDFEKNWTSASEKLKTVKKTISVPKEWKATLQRLPAPGNRSTTRKQIR